jgi:hypothetical protein
MAQTLGSLIISLTAETSAFARGMSDAKNLAFNTSADIVTSLKRVGDQMLKLKFGNEAEWKKSAEIFGGVAAGIGIAVASASLVIAKQVSEQVKEMSKLSQSYGLSIAEISQLRAASALTGVTIEQLSIGLGRLAKNASTNGAAFKTLGVEVKDGEGHLRPMNDLLLSVADRFSKLENGTGKTALAMQLFGRSGAALIPFLNQGAQGIKEMQELSDKLGMTWSESDAKNAEIFEGSLKLLGMEGDGLKEQFIKGLLPALDDISTAFLNVDQRGNSVAKTLGGTIGSSLKYLILTVNEAVAGFKELWVTFGQLNKWSGLDAEINEIDAKRAQFADEIMHPQLVGSHILTNLAHTGGTEDPTFAGKARRSKVGNSDFTSLLNEASGILDKGNKLQEAIDKIQELQLKISQFQQTHPDTIFLNLNDAVGKLADKMKLLASDSADAMRSVGPGGWQSKAALDKQIGSLLNTPVSIPENPDELRTKYDWVMKYEQAIRDLAKTRDLGYISGERYHQMEQKVLADEAMERTVQSGKKGFGGIGQGIGAGIGAIGAEWQGMPTQMAETTITMLHGMQSSFSGFFSSVAMGTKSLGRSFAELGQTMLGSVVNSLSEMLARFVTHRIAMTVFHGATNAVMVVSDAAAATASVGISLVATLKKIAHAAAHAAAWAFSTIMADIPFPVNIVLAPIGAALAFTGVMALGALASAAGGMEVDRDQLAYVHKDEKILPASISKGFNSIINGFSNQGQGAGHLAFAGAGGMGGHTFNMPIYGATDPKAVGDEVMTRVKKFFKSGGVMK